MEKQALSVSKGAKKTLKGIKNLEICINQVSCPFSTKLGRVTIDHEGVLALPTYGFSR